jgi:hypothetical protein
MRQSQIININKLALENDHKSVTRHQKQQSLRSSGGEELLSQRTKRFFRKNNFMFNIIEKARKGGIKTLGYGGEAYFTTLAAFVQIFFVLTVINWVLMLVYSTYSGFEAFRFTSFFSPYSIGNLGQSEPICQSVNFGV